MKKVVAAFLDKMGYQIVKKKYLYAEGEIPIDIAENEDFMGLYKVCKPYTMASVERLFSLYESVKYVLEKGIGGDFVECGVWRGGCSMLMALMLERAGETKRKIYLYDTFEGMPDPTQEDVSIKGEKATDALAKAEKSVAYSVWAYSPEEDVKKNMKKTNYVAENIIFVKGKVEETIPSTIPSKIALLRLDTDWYTSTKHEMEFLYPILVEKGVLIIDDYGHWEGARKAVDEYFKHTKSAQLLARVDYTGRVAIKNG